MPADRLLSGAVQRGIDSGEFRPLATHAVAHALMAPVIFLALHQHSLGACPVVGAEIDPETMLHTHLDLMLRGLQVRDVAPAKKRARKTTR